MSESATIRVSNDELLDLVLLLGTQSSLPPSLQNLRTKLTRSVTPATLRTNGDPGSSQSTAFFGGLPTPSKARYRRAGSLPVYTGRDESPSRGSIPLMTRPLNTSVSISSTDDARTFSGASFTRPHHPHTTQHPSPPITPPRISAPSLPDGLIPFSPGQLQQFDQEGDDNSGESEIENDEMVDVYEGQFHYHIGAGPHVGVGVGVGVGGGNDCDKNRGGERLNPAAAAREARDAHEAAMDGEPGHGDGNLSGGEAGEDGEDTDEASRGRDRPFVAVAARYVPHLQPSTCAVVGRLSAYCQSVMDEESWMNRLGSMLASPEWKESDQAFHEDSLISVATLCARGSQVASTLQLVRMVHAMQLFSKVESLRISQGIKTPGEIYHLYIESSLPKYPRRTYDRHYSLGARFAQIASSGSLYLLFLVAAAKMKTAIQELPDDDLPGLCEIIRRPSPDNALGRLIMHTIIPTIDRLRWAYPVKFSSMFSSQLMEEHGLPRHISAANLVQSDEFFSMLSFRTFTSARNPEAWRVCLTPLEEDTEDLSLIPVCQSVLSCGATSSEGFSRPSSPVSVEDEPHPLKRCRVDDHDDGALSYADTGNVRPAKRQQVLIDTDSDDSEEDVPLATVSARRKLHNIDPLRTMSRVTIPGLRTIRTAYNPSDRRNVEFPCRGQSKEERFAWTEEARAAAAHADLPVTYEEFKLKLETQLSRGYRVTAKQYIVVDREMLLKAEEMVRIQDKNSETVAFLGPQMPDHLKVGMLDSMEAVFPGCTKFTDTRAEGNENSYPCAHFVWYNRSTTRGDDAPSDADPYTVGREDKHHNIRPVDPSQCQPRVAKESHDLHEKWRLFEKVWEPVFRWITAIVKQIFPEDCEVLSIWAESLPGCQIPAVHPFGGVVVNFNVATRFHRDHKDDRICLVFVISDCVGGELVLYELGLVFRLHSGDMLIFRSADISHFNLHFTGRRASLVMNSDREGRSWVEDRNGWNRNWFFQETFVN